MTYLSRFMLVALLIVGSAACAQTVSSQPSRLPPGVSINGYPDQAISVGQEMPYPNPPKPSIGSCTFDAKVCPDGTTVGRTRPRCEFAPCPLPGASGVSPGWSGEGAPPDDQGYYEPPPPAPDIYKPAVPPRPDGPPQVMCTQEVKMCPDGTGVGRTGPNCEFAPCPGGKRR